MARISLDKDRELAKQGLLRVSVVADLLGVAPKTVNIWLKDATALKIRGVKYLEWDYVCKTRRDDVQFLALPPVAHVAHAIWNAGQHKLPAPTGTSDAVAHAVSALQKAKALLPAVKPPVYEKIENFESAENFEAQKVLEVPTPEAEPVLDIPQELKKRAIKTLNKLADGDSCPRCAHSVSEFHLTARCTFAKGTVAACKCPTGA